MKIRQGFVSNSSSSSFIIAKAYLSSAQENGLRDALTELLQKGRQEYDLSEGIEPQWGENEATWSEEGKYFFIETYYVYNDIKDIFTKLGIKWEDGYRICG